MVLFRAIILVFVWHSTAETIGFYPFSQHKEGTNSLLSFKEGLKQGELEVCETEILSGLPKGKNYLPLLKEILSKGGFVKLAPGQIKQGSNRSERDLTFNGPSLHEDLPLLFPYETFKIGIS